MLYQENNTSDWGTKAYNIIIIFFRFVTLQFNVQCVHKVHLGFWKIVEHMRFVADYSETLEVLFDVDRWNRRPSLRFSVSCLWNGDFFQEQTINVNTYLDMMQLYTVPQIEHLSHTSFCILHLHPVFLWIQSLLDASVVPHPLPIPTTISP
jgi:hypothetical protein